jgi:hypothetical protein
VPEVDELPTVYDDGGVDPVEVPPGSEGEPVGHAEPAAELAREADTAEGLESGPDY